MKASYFKHILNFNQPSGTSRGILTFKETWFLKIEDENNFGIGECSMLRGLSIDDRFDFEEKLVKKLDLNPSKYRTNGPSRYFSNSNNDQKIGIISAISHNFCDTCNRVRLTCTGKLYMCLGQNDFVDLKFALRNQSKADIIKLIEYAMSIKPKAHNFEINKSNYEGYINRYMNETGG